MTENTQFKTLSKKDGKFVIVNPSSIGSIEQIDSATVRITTKEVKDGQSISFEANYDLATLLDIFKANFH